MTLDRICFNATRELEITEIILQQVDVSDNNQIQICT